MLWSSLGAVTAMWLMFTPALWPASPWRAGLVAGVGMLALGASALGVPSRRIRRVVAYLGIFLGLANFFFLGASLGFIASCSVSAIFLVGAGMSPTPELVLAPAADPESVAPARNEVATPSTPTTPPLTPRLAA